MCSAGTEKPNLARIEKAAAKHSESSRPPVKENTAGRNADIQSNLIGFYNIL